MEFATAETQVKPEGGKLLEVLQGNRPGALIFGIPIPVLAGALLFIWRDGNLRRRGIVVSAKCVQQARDGKGLVTLRLAYEVDGLQYYCDSPPYQFPSAGVGVRPNVLRCVHRYVPSI
ncbi:hypothetical protein OG780_41395 [Streptomyces sp. NBC_00386]|uniref:hypothetical protein n=1 Tax=Streptomyces sp. NBC_00386 TaxID=2975734 RepID=UPI002E226CE0